LWAQAQGIFEKKAFYRGRNLSGESDGAKVGNSTRKERKKIVQMKYSPRKRRRGLKKEVNQQRHLLGSSSSLTGSCVPRELYNRLQYWEGRGRKRC